MNNCMLNRTPFDIGKIHFVGIGGIGLSGMAEILHNMGYEVQGSDMKANAMVKKLQNAGVKVFVGHDAANIEDASLLVLSSAVKENNPEVIEAKKRHLPVMCRADMLAELLRLKWSIAVAGTHGKTTTTSLVATMLEKAGLDPTIINGGIINSIGTNAKLGKGEWIVAEADESDGTFIKIPATIAVVTNIDPEHLDHYGSFDKLKEAFLTFVHNVPLQGFACLCIDHPEVQSLIPQISERKFITFGFNPQADVRAVNLTQDENGAHYDVEVSYHGKDQVIKDIFLPMHGKHNVSNSLASIAIALELNISDEIITKALAEFGGVKRRFTKTGEVDGVTIIDDYGHHPTEIAAVLKAARNVSKGSVIAVCQPHRYSRVRDLMEEFGTCFNDADTVVIADIYPAGESPIDGISRKTLAEAVRARGHKDVLELEAPDSLASLIKNMAQKGDIVVCLGAGDISAWANALPEELKKLA